MKMPPDPEWYAEKAKLEDGQEISAGLPSYVPPFIPSEADRYYSGVIAKLMRTIETSGREIIEQQEDLSEAYTKIARLEGSIESALRCLEGGPEYHYTGMGCGIEDRGITDRYDAMYYGWECAMDRVFGENIAWAKDALQSALKVPSDD